MPRTVCCVVAGQRHPAASSSDQRVFSGLMRGYSSLSAGVLLLSTACTDAFLGYQHRHALLQRALSTREGRAKASPVLAAGFDDEDDIRYSMGQKHMETGFLKRAKAEPLLTDPALLKAETLNEIYGPVETENIFVIRSMWTASCIFRLDGILIDSEDIQMRAWERVADSVGGRMPSERQVFKAMHVSPEEAIRTIFEWTSEELEARALADTFDQVVLEEFKRQELFSIAGAEQLIAEMMENEIPCAVVSNLPLQAIEYVLEQLNLTDAIEVIETFDGKLKTEAQLLLMACLEMERPPKHAVFFDFSAEGVDVAHENDMLTATLDGLYYQEFEVTQCDAKLVRLNDWTMPRFRQLIEAHPFDEQYLTMTAMAAARAPVKRKISVATYDIYKYEKDADGKVVPTQEYLETQKKRDADKEDSRRGRRPLPDRSNFFKPKQADDDDEDMPELPDL